METPRIYAACLASYNNAQLHGEWIDCDQDSDDIMAEIKTMLSNSPMAKIQTCEEWAIHDYEGFEGIKISEHESIERVTELAAAIAEHGEAFAAYVEYYGSERIEDFEERYVGCYKSKKDCAEEYYEESGIIKQVEEAGLKACYINFEMIAREMFMDGYSGVQRGYETLYVFRDY
jgi:antirestriction protein